MKFGVWEIFQILGSLAFFIYGMKLMSEGIQRAAGSQMRNIIRMMTKNRFIGVFTGFIITALVQSSSATTVMTVSFVNAGLLSLTESAGVMMGANIGTTITGWIISLLGFRIKLDEYSIPIFALAVPMLFSNNGKWKYWGEFLIGFAILFFGLALLRESFPDLKNNHEALSWLTSFANWGFLSRLMFVLIGALVTVLIQSSSAAMAITLTMVSQGWLPLDIAAAMVLGENIGTTVTAEVAAIIGNTSSKRSARIHSMFNIIGVSWMILLLPIFLPLVQRFMGLFFGTADAPITLAAFHTLFNLANVILLVGFVPILVKVASWSIKGNDDESDEFRLKFISSMTRTPELATVELQKETGHFGEVMARMSGFTRNLVNSTDTEIQKELHEKIKKYEKISDKMEVEITEYITKLANQELTPETSLRLRSIINVVNDLERIGDIYLQISKTIKFKNEEKAYFTPKQRQNINEFCDKLDEAFKVMQQNLNTPSYSDVKKMKADKLESEINALKSQLREEHLMNLGAPEYNLKSAMIYNDIFQALEKVGDHIINVTESIVGEV